MVEAASSLLQSTYAKNKRELMTEGLIEDSLRRATMDSAEQGA